MQFTFVVIATMAAAVSAVETIPVYTRSTNSTAMSSGVASSTIASTGVITVPTSTGSPIAYATGAASMHSVSGLAAFIAGGVALLL